MSDQLVLAWVRSGDPHSATVGRARARTTSQKAMILRELYRYDGFDVSVDADQLHELWPGIQRSVISTRLSAMARAGLLVKDRTAVPVTFKLSALGRVEAGRLNR